MLDENLPQLTFTQQMAYRENISEVYDLFTTE